MGMLRQGNQEAPGNGLLQLHPPLDGQGKKFSRKDKTMGWCDKVIHSLTATASAQCDSGAQPPPTSDANCWDKLGRCQSQAKFGFTSVTAVEKMKDLSLLCLHTLPAAPTHTIALRQGANCFGGAPRPG